MIIVIKNCLIRRIDYGIKRFKNRKKSYRKLSQVKARQETNIHISQALQKKKAMSRFRLYSSTQPTTKRNMQRCGSRH